MTVLDNIIGHAYHEYDHVVKNVEGSHNDKQVKSL